MFEYVEEEEITAEPSSEAYDVEKHFFSFFFIRIVSTELQPQPFFFFCVFSLTS